MSLHDEKLEGVRVIGEGSFRLDRRRAMDKLARFQLEDPHQYVLELVAAAVCAGASSVQVRNDADDLEMSWDGDHPTREELDALFDWIFSRDDDPRSRMLRHLAQGVFGALGLDPRWVRVERPGLTWDFTDPANVTTSANERKEGVRVHVRERLGMAVFGDAFGGPRESRLLRRRASVCPIPIRLGGVEISGTPSHRPHAPSGRRGEETAEHHLWLSTRRDARSELASFPDRTGTVALLRDGILAGWMAATAGPLCLAGWTRAQDLKLNASLSAPIQDAAWDAVQAELYGLLATWVAQSLDAPDHDLDAESLRWAALELFALDRGRDLLQDAKLFRDLNGRPYSSSDLRESRVYLLRTLDLADPSHPSPQFAAEPPPGPPSAATMQAECLQLFRVKQGESLFQALGNGRRRREVLAREVTPLEHGSAALLERAFRGEGLRGTVAIPLGDPDGDALHIELRVEDLPIETVHVEVAGPLSARVASDALRATPDFGRVERDKAYKDLIERVKDEAEALTMAAARQLPTNPRVRQLLYNWLRHVKISKSDRKQGRIVPPLPASVAQAPLFTDLSGKEHSLDDLRGGGPANREILQTTLHHVPPGFQVRLGVEGVLRLDEPARGALRHLLPRPLKDVREDLTARAEAERRRERGRHEPVLRATAVARAAVSEEGFAGEVGLVENAEAPCALDVVHEGVLLCILEVPDAPKSTVAALEIAGLEPNLAWDGVRDERALLARVTPVLQASLGQLIVGRAAEVDPRLPLPGWLWPFLEASEPWPEALTSLPLFPTAGGDLLALSQVAAQEEIWWSPGMALLKGLEDVLILDPTRKHALRCLADRLKEASKLVDELTRGRQAFFGRTIQNPGLPGSLRFCGRTPVLGDGVRGEAGVIDGSAARPGLQVVYRHLRRGLCTDSLPFPAPVQVVLEGPAVLPNPRFDGLDQSVDAAPFRAMALEAAKTACATTLAEASGGLFAPILVLRAALDPKNPDLVPPETLAAARDAPLFQLVGGRRASLHTLLEDAAAGRVRVVPRDYADAEPPPGDTRWLLAGKVVRDVFSLAGRPNLPDGTVDLDRWRAGQARRRDLPWQPFVPEHLEASATVLRRREDRQIFLALPNGPSEGLVLSWHAEGRLVSTEQFPCPVAVHAVVTAGGLRGDEAFENPVPEALADSLAEEARALVPDFLLAAARALDQGTDPDGDLPVVLLWAEGVRATLVRWGASKRRKLPKEWAEIPVFPTSTGDRISLPDLFAAAKRKRLRVVGPTCHGRPFDPERPVLVVERDGLLQQTLNRFFELEWVEESLAREEAAWQRREAPPQPWLARPNPSAVLTLPPPEGCEGTLAVLSSGASGVTLHVGWRELETVGAPGPVPLQGHVSDERLETDPYFSQAVGTSRQRILRALEETSNRALETLLEKPDPAADRALWLRILRRSFDDREALRKAPEGGVADLPLFETGDWKPLSARQVAAAEKVRWVVPGRTFHAMDPDRPFVRATASERDVLAGVLPGFDAQAEAERETETWRRRQTTSAFQLPERAWLARLEDVGSSARLLLGLDRALESPGRMAVRCAGVAIEERDLEALGVYAIVEVSEKQVERGWRSAKLTTEQNARIASQIAPLFTLACDAVRSSPRTRRRLCRILSKRVERTDSAELVAGNEVSAWVDAPLLEGPEGETSLRQVAARLHGGGAVVWGSEEADGALVLLRSPSNRALLSSVRLADRVERLRRWQRRVVRERRAQDAAERAEAARRARDALSKAMESRSKLLLTGIEHDDTVLVDALLDCQGPRRDDPVWPAALEDPEGPAGWLLAWRAVDLVLTTRARFEDAAEVAVRMAERLAKDEGES